MNKANIEKILAEKKAVQEALERVRGLSIDYLDCIMLDYRIDDGVRLVQSLIEFYAGGYKEFYRTELPKDARYCVLVGKALFFYTRNGTLMTSKLVGAVSAPIGVDERLCVWDLTQEALGCIL